MTITGSETRLERSLVRAVAWNAAANWTTQIISWSSTIIVARLLTPYDYGLVGMAGLYLSLAMLISQSGIADAVVTLRDLTRRQIAQLNTVAVLVGAVLVVLTCAMAQPLAQFFSAPPLRAVVFVVSATYLVNALQVVPRALLQKELQFKLLASLETARVVCQVVATVTLAWLGFGYWSLVIGHIMGAAFATASTLCWRRHDFALPNFFALRRELRFSGHVLLSRVGWYVYSNADFLVAGRVFGSVPLGYYSMAWTISSAPVEKIGNLITGVTPAFFAAVQHDAAELRRYLLKLTEALSYVTVPASIGIALVADCLVPVLLGPKWLGVIGPLRLLVLYIAVRSLTTLLPTVLTATGDTRFVMWTTLLAAVVMPIGFLIGSRWGINGIAMAWIIMYPPLIFPMYYKMFQRIGMRTQEYLSSITPALVASAVMSGGVMLARWALSGASSSLIRLSVLVSVGAVVYAGTLLVFYRARVTALLRAIRGSQQPASAEAVAGLG